MPSALYYLSSTGNAAEDRLFRERLTTGMEKGRKANKCFYVVSCKIQEANGQSTMEVSSCTEEQPAWQRLIDFIKKEFGGIAVELGGKPIDPWPWPCNMVGFIQKVGEDRWQQKITSILARDHQFVDGTHFSLTRSQALFFERTNYDNCVRTMHRYLADAPDSTGASDISSFHDPNVFIFRPGTNRPSPSDRRTTFTSSVVSLFGKRLAPGD